MSELDDLSPRALISLEEARSYVLRDRRNTSKDDQLISAIDDVSETIWDACRREFKPTATAEARVFPYDGSGWLDLAPFDLRTLTSVTLYTDLPLIEQRPLVAGDYRLEPRGKALGGTYVALSLPVPAGLEPAYGFAYEVTIVGDWGMAAVPGAVKWACKIAVDNVMKNPGAYAGQTLGPAAVAISAEPLELGGPGSRGALPRSAMLKLQPYARRRVVTSVPFRRASTLRSTF